MRWCGGGAATAMQRRCCGSAVALQRSSAALCGAAVGAAPPVRPPVVVLRYGCCAMGRDAAAMLCCGDVAVELQGCCDSAFWLGTAPVIRLGGATAMQLGGVAVRLCCFSELTTMRQQRCSCRDAAAMRRRYRQASVGAWGGSAAALLAVLTDCWRCNIPTCWCLHPSKKYWTFLTEELATIFCQNISAHPLNQFAKSNLINPYHNFHPLSQTIKFDQFLYHNLLFFTLAID